MTRTVIATAMALLLLKTGAALAQSPADTADCLGHGNASNDQIIASCTRVIQLGGQGGGQLAAQDMAAVYFNRGVAHNLNSQPDPAIADFDQALKLRPDDPATLDQRGAAYFSKGDFARALDDFNQSIRLDPNDFNAYNNRGAIYYALSEWAKAVADFTSAISLNPKVALIYQSRGFALDRMGQHDKALADYDKAIRLDPSLKRRH